MVDKSPQGYIDKDLLPLLQKINKNKGWLTTSSCSGRIVLIKNLKKGEAKWLLKSHTAVKPETVWQAIQSSKARLWFLQEPFILHVKCSSSDAALNLVKIANKAGFRSAYLSPGTLTLEIKGSERIETVLQKDVVSFDYIKMLVNEANKKLSLTKQRIKKFYKYLPKLI